MSVSTVSLFLYIYFSKKNMELCFITTENSAQYKLQLPSSSYFRFAIKSTALT